MSRTGPHETPKPRRLEGIKDLQDTPDSKYRSKENQRVSLEQCSTPVTEDDDGDGSTSSTLERSYARFRSRDFQQHFYKTRSYRTYPIPSPMPRFSWADSADVWKNMLGKESIYMRDPALFQNHPSLTPRMRAILLDWLAEVCQIHALHRETFCLAQDFVDRYLSVSKGVTKSQLQLLGTSALFLAAKLEEINAPKLAKFAYEHDRACAEQEIYPPKLADFAFVTDGACTEQQIIKQEMILVKALKWDLAPMTTNGWLGFFLQAANIEHITDLDQGFVFPMFSTHAFVQLSRLCDLSLLDYGSLHFRYSTIAAAALYHHTNENVVGDVSGLTWSDIYGCVKWMAPFASAILEVGQSPVKFFQDVVPEDCHNIQTHNVGLVLLERGLSLQALYRAHDRLKPSSLDLSAQLVGLLLPPDDDDSDDDGSDNNGSDDNGSDVNISDVNGSDVNGGEINGGGINGAGGGGDDSSSPDISMEDDDGSS